VNDISLRLEAKCVIRQFPYMWTGGSSILYN